MRVVDLVDANGSDSERGRNLMAKDLGARGALVGVDQLARHDLVPEEGLTVCEMGMGEPCV